MNFAHEMNEKDLAHLALDATQLEAAKEAAAAVTALLPPEPALDRSFLSPEMGTANAVVITRYQTYLEAATAAWKHAAYRALDMLRNQEERPCVPDQQYLCLAGCLALLDGLSLEEARDAATDWEHYPWPTRSGAEITRIGKEQAQKIRLARAKLGPQDSMH